MPAKQYLNPDTKTIYTVQKASEMDMDVGDKWATTCEKHGTVLGSSTRKLAIEAAEYPEWCGECQDILP